MADEKTPVEDVKNKVEEKVEKVSDTVDEAQDELFNDFDFDDLVEIKTHVLLDNPLVLGLSSLVIGGVIGGIIGSQIEKNHQKNISITRKLQNVGQQIAQNAPDINFNKVGDEMKNAGENVVGWVKGHLNN